MVKLTSAQDIERLSEESLTEVLAALRNPIVFLNKYQAIAYVLWSLKRGDCYPSGLILNLPEMFPGFEVSDTIIYAALGYLDRMGVISRYNQKSTGLGRPRRMLELVGTASQIDQLSDWWVKFAGSRHGY